MNPREVVAIVPVRDGVAAPGGIDAVAEACGSVVLAGSATAAAVDELAGVARHVELAELGPYAPGGWAAALAPLVEDARCLVLPASPDGRDLAPRLAAELLRPLLAGCTLVTPTGATVVRLAGLVQQEVSVDGPFVATLEPGVRAVAVDPAVVAEVRTLELGPPDAGVAADGEVLEVLPPDPATMDLAEAPRIIGGGAGLMRGDDAEVTARFGRLAAVGEALGASMGATRVVTDAGHVGHARQIGTTGVVVDPRLYLALGISGAVQHTAGLGHPDHVISVNLDPHCPMMAMADLAVVADANATLDVLAARLGVDDA